MATKINIANKALSALGQDGITSFTDSTDRAAAINEVYTEILKEVLEETEWNFSTKRANLATVVVTIPWTDDGLINAYAYPSDCIKILNLNDENLVWRVEVVDSTKVILTDSSALKIRYVFFNENPSQYSAKFVIALAARLAAELSYQINRSVSEYNTRLAAYHETYLPAAISANSQEGSVRQPRQDHFANSKFGLVPNANFPGKYYG